MILRANNPLQTACQGARVLFDGIVPHDRRPRASRAILKVLQLPQIRRKNMPVSLTAALQFLPTRVGRRFPYPTRNAALERCSNGHLPGPSFAGTQVAGCPGPWTSGIPMHLQTHKPKPPVEEPTPEPDERAPVEEPDRPDPGSPRERPRR